jgi:hypothetical protein
VILFENGRLATAIEVEVAAGAVRRIIAQRNPAKLVALRDLAEDASLS